MSDKIRFSEHVYNCIVEGDFWDADIPMRLENGVITGYNFSVVYKLTWFGFGAKVVELHRFDDRKVYNIPLSLEEEEMLWSVWDKVDHIKQQRKLSRQLEKNAKRERMTWWP